MATKKLVRAREERGGPQPEDEGVRVSKRKPVTHVNKKDGTAWCGGKKPKSAPFDADACPKCAKIVRESFGKSEAKTKTKTDA